jgi:hypothetical protein
VNSVLASVIATVGTRPGDPELLALVEEARREWEDARGYFNSVSDPDLIDHAVYVNQAAEKRFMYLLKQARSQGIQSSSLLPRPQA